MKYLYVILLALILGSCTKNKSQIYPFETNIFTRNAQGELTTSFQLGEEITFRYTIRNTAQELAEYYNSNCPLMSCKVYDASDVLMGELYPPNTSCVEALYLNELQPLELKVYERNWSGDSTNAPLPTGVYKVKISDEIEVYSTGETRPVNLELLFTVE